MRGDSLPPCWTLLPLLLLPPCLPSPTHPLTTTTHQTPTHPPYRDAERFELGPIEAWKQLTYDDTKKKSSYIHHIFPTEQNKSEIQLEPLFVKIPTHSLIREDSKELNAHRIPISKSVSHLYNDPSNIKENGGNVENGKRKIERLPTSSKNIKIPISKSVSHLYNGPSNVKENGGKIENGKRKIERTSSPSSTNIKTKSSSYLYPVSSPNKDEETAKRIQEPSSFPSTNTNTNSKLFFPPSSKDEKAIIHKRSITLYHQSNLENRAQKQPNGQYISPTTTTTTTTTIEKISPSPTTTTTTDNISPKLTKNISATTTTTTRTHNHHNTSKHDLMNTQNTSPTTTANNITSPTTTTTHNHQNTTKHDLMNAQNTPHTTTTTTHNHQNTTKHDLMNAQNTPHTTTTTTTHHHRHQHLEPPDWLRPHLQRSDSIPGTRRRSISRKFEEKIESVFLGVAYGGSRNYRRRIPAKEKNARIERTTASLDKPINDEPQDVSFDDADMTNLTDKDLGHSDSDNVTKTVDVDDSVTLKDVNNATKDSLDDIKDSNNIIEEESELQTTNSTLLGAENLDNLDTGNIDNTTDALSPTEIEPEIETTNVDVNITHEHTTPKTEVPRVTETTEGTVEMPRVVPTHPYKWSWMDVLRCTNQGVGWVLVNFILGMILLLLSLLVPYRLLTLRSCTPLLPRTHYVAVHLLAFVAGSLKAVYLFHLAFGSRGRLPLVLLLLLTNTGFSCLSSAFVVLMMMMFAAADVQVYKSKVVTPHNTFLLLLVMLVLGFIADVIVGGAHSRSVLVMSRLMVIGVAVGAVAVFVRRQNAVLGVSEMMKREFQGEMKLLVMPAREEAAHKQAGVKCILRNRLSWWCCAVRVCAGGLSLLSLIHLLHTVFLVSSQVPEWAWWVFHVSGCLVEAVLVASVCVSAALTQRYDQSVSFAFSFLVPAILLRRSGLAGQSEGGGAGGASVNRPEMTYQRVSFSSGTESTHYTACYPDPVANITPTPQTTKRRNAPVKRSATFSHAASNYPGQVQGRVGSTSNILAARRPMYGLSIPLPHAHTPHGSVLVHEDGFVRVRTPLDHLDGPALRPHGSLILLQQSHFQGSTPQLRDTHRPDTVTRKWSHDALRNNMNVTEPEEYRNYHDYRSSPPSRMSFNLPSPARDDAIYHSNPHSPTRTQLAYTNNLDQPDWTYARQESREDNNDPIHHHCDPRGLRNLHEDHRASRSSPAAIRKVTNRSSPSSPDSPRHRRQARFPKPFVRAGSNRSLQGEDLYSHWGGEYPRGTPVRRNHSSAGYYPSRYHPPSTPDPHRYNSLRLNRHKHHNYHYSPDRHYRPPEDPRTRTLTPDAPQEEAAAPRDCPSRQSTGSSKRSDDQDWATELIKSSTMLTDFYSLPRKPKRKEKKIVEEEQEQEQEQKE